MIKELQQFEKINVLVNGCDAYLNRMRKHCKNLVIELYSILWVQLMINCCYIQLE